MKPFYLSGKRGTEFAPLGPSWMFTPSTTFPFTYADLRRRPPATRGHAPRGARGFTLLELMVVVIIITIVSTIAIPGVVQRMKTNRTRQAAEDLALIFRQARTRAIGRTSAVLVRYNAGLVEVREGIRGGLTPGCEPLPESSCVFPANRWDAVSARSQRIELTDYVASGDFALAATYDSGLGAAPEATLDMCFAPSGRAYIRNTAASATPLTPWTGIVRFDINRNDGVGLQRTILVAPSGTARVVATP